MIFSAFKKTIGICMIAFGLGAFIVILLPFWGWVALISCVLIILGLVWLFC
ncbi:MAG: hypothetical protein RR922_03990 [Clostridia bacterium]